ncbi:MAG: STAS domain-containing protein [Nostocaceae cyanobacterium]|nr:STAS domain-containing protein [Nostocaceae cyanobacterium]
MSPVVNIIQPSGTLDATQATQLRQEVINLLAGGKKNILLLIDFRDVTFMDSSGLGALVQATKMIRAVSGQMFLCSLNQQVQMLLEMTSMNNAFQIYPNQEEFNKTVLSSIN